jgi:adenylosuccinate synthase
MRSGFICELFNQRGVHGFSSGEEEKKLATDFHKKADSLEDRGYQRIATAVRGIAKSYEQDAERESKRNPYGELIKK